MQYCSCVFILGHAEPQNWFNSGVGGGLYSIISGKSAFLRQLLYILTFLFKNAELGIKKKKSQPLFSNILGRSKKDLFFV